MPAVNPKWVPTRYQRRGGRGGWAECFGLGSVTFGIYPSGMPMSFHQRLGDKTVLLDATLMVPDNDFAELEFADPPGPMLKFRFKFSDKDGPRGVTWSVADGVVNFTVTGWAASDSHMGLKKPLRIGSASDGDEMGIIFFGTRIVDVDYIHMQILKGGRYA